MTTPTYPTYRPARPDPKTPLEWALWFGSDLNAEEFERLRRLNEQGGAIVAEALNVLYMLWNTTLAGMDDDDVVLAARVAADTGYRLREAALALGLVGVAKEHSPYLDRGPLLERAEEAIAAARHFLEHHAGAGVAS